MLNLKKGLQLNKVTIGSWITMGHPSIAEVMSDTGFEWLVVDMEHSVISFENAQELVRAIQAKNLPSLIRVGENNPNLIKKAMDTGANGIIVPMVNTKEDAIKAVSAAKYPPIGNRGVGLARAQGYGFKFEEYKKWLSDSVVIIQIEHIEAVNNLDSILSVDGIDACFVGPYDLSGSLGIPGKFDNPQVLEALKKIEQTCKQKGISLGMHVITPDHSQVSTYIEKGYNFIAFSLDTLFLGTKCREQLTMLINYTNQE